MFKCAAAVVLLLVVVDTVKVMREPFFKTKDLRETRTRFDEAKEFDVSEKFNADEEFDEREEFEGEEDSSEDAVALQVHYLDAVRAALLEISADIRGDKRVTNALLQIIDRFERKIANFQASLGRRAITPGAVSDLERYTGEEATAEWRKNPKFLQSLTALRLFAAEKSDVKPRAKRESDSAIVEGARAFLVKLRKRIGDTTFKKFLGIEGLVTLVFAIDNTGSMVDEIEAAATIATHIVHHHRDFKVDYLLSPFNDPGTGPITYKDADDGEEFVKVLKNLTTYGGGDCSEMTFTGMIDAFGTGRVQYGSPMYVFTDASPKDATETNVRKILDLADSYSSSIYFFSKAGCGNPSDYNVYEKVASKSFGLIFPLRTTDELTQLGAIVRCRLNGRAVVTWGSTETVPASGRLYTIIADDSMECLIITITLQTDSCSGIRLIDPNRNTVTGSGCVCLLKKVIYYITKPIPGVYRLYLPAGAGEYSYSVDTSSDLNLNFRYYYTYIQKRGYIVPVPMDNPLQGYPTTLFITLAGVEFVDPSSPLLIKVVGDDGTVHVSQFLVSVGDSRVRYLTTFDPPPGPFKLELHGRTKEGYRFLRTSPSHDQVEAVKLRPTSYSLEWTLLPVGQTTIIPMQVQRGDTGDDVETYQVSVHDDDTLGYARVLNPTRSVGRGRIGIIQLEIVVPASAATGQYHVDVQLTKTGETNPIATLRLSFQVINH